MSANFKVTRMPESVELPDISEFADGTEITMNDGRVFVLAPRAWRRKYAAEKSNTPDES
jgi:hypothetical protein